MHWTRCAFNVSPMTTISRRVSSVDIVRGAIMVLMALDHVRDYVTNQRFRPEDLSRASVALFATRWVTHFCAPAFSLLAGVGVGLYMSRGRSAAETSRYLVTRGLWLLFLELVVTPVGWQFGFHLIPAFALVLWALGWSMIVLAALIHLPRWLVATLSIVVIAGHNLLDRLPPSPLWQVLHIPGFVIPGKLFVGYPLIPWVAVMSLGYALADIYRWEAARRRRFLVRTGAFATAAFVAIRYVNGYGDLIPWSAQRTPALTVASFLNVMKYPPSLDFLLMTLGPILIALALTEGMRGRVANWLMVYGRVPLFFYVLHIFVAHAVAVVLALVQGGELRRIPVVSNPELIPAWYGVSLPGVYLAWAFVVGVMYVPCRWYAGLKARRSDWWLRYT